MKRQRARRFYRRLHALHGRREVVDRLGRVAGRILDRATHHARLCGCRDRARGRARLVRIAVLEIRAHRQRRRLRDLCAVGEELVAADGAGAVSRDELLANCAQIAQATPLPVSADLENCYAHEPRAAARTITAAAQAGVVGGSIEDATGDATKPIYDFTPAVERVQAAVEAARSLPFHFTLTARADGLMHARDLDDTIRRLQAFE